MVDRWTIQIVKQPLIYGALFLHRQNVSADQVTLFGALVGLLCLPLLFLNFYYAALVCIIINRIADGLDGPLARMTKATDCGAFLDITLDFIFYSAVVFGFALADPTNNSLAAAALLFSFIGTGSSFLAFGIMAERHNISNFRFANKGFYYLDGLAEGTETIIFLVLFCVFPQHFSLIAWFFASICYLTTIIRILTGFKTLKEVRAQ